MGTTNDNQDITSEAPKLLLCSSIASASDPGSNAVTKPQAGIGKEHPELSWYYMYLSYKELKRYIAVFSGRKAVKLRTSEGITEECYFCFKVFSYTEAGHRKRFEQCDYTKQEYAARRESARIVKEAFSTGSASQLNALTDEKEVQSSGWLFVCAPLEQLQRILSAMLPRQYLVTDYVTHRAAVIPQCQMEEFIYLYESMPYNIELMNRPLEDYLQKKQKIRMEVRTAFLRHKEALQEVEALKLSVRQAQENYRIMQNRYLNQLAILTDLLDANSVLLNAELQLTNARTHVIYTYYQLQKACGRL